MKFCSLLLMICPLAATVNEPLRCELFTGYRNDRIHWHLQQPGEGGALTYSELYRDVEFWENGLTLKAIHRDFVFFMRGSYAAFGKGNLFQRYAHLSFTSEEPHFSFNSSGWAADGSGYFGYAVNLTAERTYKVLLIPLLGVSTHFERLDRKRGSPDLLESQNAVGADFFTMRSSLPHQLRLTWYGFLVGVGFTIEPGGRLIFNAGYTHHWLRHRLKTQVQNEVALFMNGPALVSDQITAFSLKVSEGGNLGQTGWAQIDSILTPFWRIGLGAQIHYFSSRVLDGKEKQEITPAVPAGLSATSTFEQKYKLRWTSISGWLQVSGEF